jgi:hypothetical protein
MKEVGTMCSSREERQTSLALRKKTRKPYTVIQHSPIAGFRHHEAPLLWDALRPRLAVTVAREPNNSHDPDAAALFWRGHKLGYLPRGENFLVARLLECDRPISARIRRLLPNAERNLRIQVEVILH